MKRGNKIESIVNDLDNSPSNVPGIAFLILVSCASILLPLHIFLLH